MDLNKTPGVGVLWLFRFCHSRAGGNPGERLQGGSPTEAFGDDRKRGIENKDIL